MNTIQLPFLVEGIIILAAMLFGVLLDRAGKPYGKVKLVIHLFFVLWFFVGFVFILRELFKIDVARVTWIPIALMGLMILTQLVTGISMLISEKAGRILPRIHVTSAILLLLSDVCVFIISGNRS
jgi:hypothetical protein